ncbi:MAG TPA: isoprenylcysteine carboxylmethyltransferase family protein [Terracidiphilus sp.]|jgi:protein-S-isoprenylcysteine O-methyltransferase Ste14
MRASAIEFRLRLVIIAVIVVLGFWSPWIETLHIGRRISLLEWLALELSRTGLANFTVATPAVIIAGTLTAALGAALRVWGTAYLGSGTVNHLQMQAGAVMADGPYRYVRNPLYLGTEFTMLATAFIMPPTGAVFTMVLLSVFLLRLILGEEAFLGSRLGDPYTTYLGAVPRIVPRLRTNLKASGYRPRWFTALLAELYPLGVLGTLAALSWKYDNRLMIRAILVSFGVSLVARALQPQAKTKTSALD